MNYVSHTAMRLWNFLICSAGIRPQGAEVIVHDPAAQKVQNLDDPFLDPETQRRIGKLIGDSSNQRKLP
jgi:hypothetical protein